MTSGKRARQLDTRAAQGLPPTVDDPAALAHIAALLTRPADEQVALAGAGKLLLAGLDRIRKPQEGA